MGAFRHGGSIRVLQSKRDEFLSPTYLCAQVGASMEAFLVSEGKRENKIQAKIGPRQFP